MGHQQPSNRQNESNPNPGAGTLSAAPQVCPQISARQAPTQPDYEDLMHLLGGETLWRHIESRD